MGFFDQLFGRIDADAQHRKHQDDIREETSKVKAYRNAEEVAAAARVLMEKAEELREEIEALAHE